MTDYFIDDGGDNSDGLSWATAWNSIGDMLADASPIGTSGAPFTATDRLIFGADSVDAYNYGGTVTVYGPSSGVPCVVLSSTVGSGTTVSYAAGTARHINVSETSSQWQDLIWDGSFALYGLYQQAMTVTLNCDANETALVSGGAVVNMANQQAVVCGIQYTEPLCELRNLTINCANDGTTNRVGTVILAGNYATIIASGLSFSNAAYRTGTIFGSGKVYCSGSDFSGFTNGTACELAYLDGGTGTLGAEFCNCLTAATWVPFTGSPGPSIYGMCVNVGPADAPTYLYYTNYFGAVASSASIYRTGGATVEGDACSWLITTTANCAEGAPFYTPWIYGTVSSTGSKTFDLYIANDTADFDDDEAWLEVEYLSTSDEAIWALATDQRTITTTAAAQTDDTTSTWNGTGPSFTYKQKLSVTATVNETGQFRARVAVGAASIAGSRYFYADPKVTVS